MASLALESNWLKEALLRYDVYRFLHDIARIKGKALTEKERLFLLAAVLGKTIADIITVWRLSIKSAQVFADKIKGYLKQLMVERLPGFTPQEKQRLFWCSLPGLISQMGYERRSEAILEKELLRRCSSKPLDIDVQQLIGEMRRTYYRKVMENWQPRDLTDNSDAQINPILNASRNSPDADKFRAAYRQAIEVSRLLMTQDPVRYFEHWVKIVQNLSFVGRYEDSVPLALALMQYVDTPEAKGKLAFSLGVAYEKIAKKTLSDCDRQRSIVWYEQSLSLNPQSNCPPLYNIFSLNLEFYQRLKDMPEYLEETQMTLRKFMRAAQIPESNFSNHKMAIQDDIRKILEMDGSLDPILRQDLEDVLAW